MSETISRAEERIVVQPVQVEAGRLRISRHVVEEPREIEVTLHHDQLQIERATVDRPLAADERTVTELDDETVILRLEERLEVRRVPWVVEEIRLRRHPEPDRQRVTETVRAERIDIEAEGDIDVSAP